jgi:hypothetical protein
VASGTRYQKRLPVGALIGVESDYRVDTDVVAPRGAQRVPRPTPVLERSPSAPRIDEYVINPWAARDIGDGHRYLGGAA